MLLYMDRNHSWHEAGSFPRTELFSAKIHFKGTVLKSLMYIVFKVYSTGHSKMLMIALGLKDSGVK